MFFPSSRKGQGLVEYALILVLVSVVVIAILSLLGPQIGHIFSSIIDGLDGGSVANTVPEIPTVAPEVPTVAPCNSLYLAYNAAANAYGMADYYWTQGEKPTSGPLFEDRENAYNALNNAWDAYSACTGG